MTESALPKHRAQEVDRLHLWPGRSLRNVGYGVFMSGVSIRLGYETYTHMAADSDLHTAIGGLMLIATGATALCAAGFYEVATAERRAAPPNCGLDIMRQDS